MPLLCVMGTTGKLGSAVLDALLSYNLVLPPELVISTSSSIDSPRWDSLKSRGASVRQANYDDPASMQRAFAGCAKLLLVSSSRISMDYAAAGDDDWPADGNGREAHHYAAIRAARAAGVGHIYYTSLAFADRSRSRVMAAHNRTEAFLAREFSDGKGYTVVRVGLYSESWPLYLGHYDPAADDRREIVVAGDGPVGWTAIKDLGLATATILADAEEKWAGKTVVLASTTMRTLSDVAQLLSQVKEQETALKIVSRDQYEAHYVNERGLDEGHIKWWARTYDALPANECNYHDTTLQELLAEKGRKPKSFEETLDEMLS